MAIAVYSREPAWGRLFIPREGSTVKKMLLCCSAMLWPMALAAQTPPAPASVVETTMSGTMVSEYKTAKQLLTDVAAAMPAEAYAFQPTPEMRTFAGTMGHILTSNLAQCGMFLGRKHALAGQDLSKTLTTKADIVKTVADTFAFCDEYFLKIDDKASIADSFVTMNGRRNGEPVTFHVSNGASIVHFLDHNNEEYGYLAVYLRLKGITPPSSVPHPAPGRSGGAGR